MAVYADFTAVADYWGIDIFNEKSVGQRTIGWRIRNIK